MHALNVNGRPFIEKHACAYAPSAAVLLRAAMRSSPVPPPDSALVLGYTASADEFERRIFLGEAETVAGLFGAAPRFRA